MNAISLFAGCGGFDLGLHQAGYRVLWANEIDEHAQASYRANHGGFLDTRDIQDVEPEDVLSQTRLAVGELDLMAGGPPCQPFSTAGARSAKWNGVIERLSFEFVRLARGLRPRGFVMENVPGMKKGVSVGVFNEVLGEMQAAGYRVAWREIDANWFGVPQERRRLIFVGVREDLGIDPVFPLEQEPRLGISHVIPEAVSVEGWDCYGQLVMRPASLPMPTVLASQRNPLQWRDVAGALRAFTIDDMKRVCGFPSDFVLAGSERERWKRLGNCVPPPMAKAIGLAIREAL
jgi:DNA (cytosine-5)-methyltransferase 1